MEVNCREFLSIIIIKAKHHELGKKYLKMFTLNFSDARDYEPFPSLPNSNISLLWFWVFTQWLDNRQTISVLLFNQP
jgi:hypothetical protein